jgi:hypothetical protein
VVGGFHRLGVGPEDHALQEREQVGTALGLGVDPDGAVQFGEYEVVQHPAVQIEVEILRGLPVTEVGDMLTRDRVQPGEPLRAGDAQDVTMRTVDDRGALRRRALFAERIAVVPGDGGVG